MIGISRLDVTHMVLPLPLSVLLHEETKPAIRIDINFTGLAFDGGGKDKSLSDGPDIVFCQTLRSEKTGGAYALSLPSALCPAAGPEVAISIVQPFTRCCSQFISAVFVGVNPNNLLTAILTPFENPISLILMNSSIGTPPDHVVKTYASSANKALICTQWSVFHLFRRIAKRLTFVHSQASRWHGNPSQSSRMSHLSAAAVRYGR